MPRRNETIRVDQVYRIKNLDTGKAYRIYSIEQMQEMIERGEIADNEIVQIQSSPHGFGGDRGKVEDATQPKVIRVTL